MLPFGVGLRTLALLPPHALARGRRHTGLERGCNGLYLSPMISVLPPDGLGIHTGLGTLPPGSLVPGHAQLCTRSPSVNGKLPLS